MSATSAASHTTGPWRRRARAPRSTTTQRALVIGSIACLGILATADGAAAMPTTPSDAARSQRLAAPPGVGASSAADLLGGLALLFTPNAGQVDRRVRYLAEANGFGVYFRSNKVVLSLTRPAAMARWQQQFSALTILTRAGARRRADGVALELRFPGARPGARPEAQVRTAAKVSYLNRSERGSLHALPTFGAVTYRDLWPGIDLRFSGSHGKLKYEFHVAPGADPRRIHVAYDGAERLAVASGGGLDVSTVLGTLNDAKPVSYQPGPGGRSPVASRYALTGKAGYGFALGGYDRSRPLVIDPGLDYSTFVGGSNADQGTAIAVDATKHAYVTGVTSSFDFPVTAGAFTTSSPGQGDVFVAKLNVAGTALEYSTFLGGSLPEAFFPGGLAIDASGSAYVTGSTNSADFPVTAGSFDTTYNGVVDAFVAKLAADGSALIWSTFVGGAGDERGNAVAIDAAGNAYVTGRTDSADFPVTAGAYDTSLSTGGANDDAFVAKLDSSGQSLSYSTYLGGSPAAGPFDRDEPFGIAVDGAGSAYVAGTTNNPSFPTTASAFDQTFDGSADAFVTKLHPDGSLLDYSTFLGGSGADPPGSDVVQAIALDGQIAYVTGTTGSPDFPTTALAYDPTFGGGVRSDAFVTKLSATGQTLEYSTYLGGAPPASAAGYDRGFGIAVHDHQAYLTGHTYSADFETTPSAYSTTIGGIPNDPLGEGDAFVTKLSQNGQTLAYSTFLGGAGTDFGHGIAVDQDGSIYVTGLTTSADFPTTTSAFDTSPGGSSFADAFVTKLSPDGVPVGEDGFALTLGPATAINPVGSSHTVTAALTDQSGPVAGKPILFTVSGVNPGTGAATTSAAGVAPFTYTGASAGTDAITACADIDGDAICDPGEPTATAVKTWVATPPAPPPIEEPPTETTPHEAPSGDEAPDGLDHFTCYAVKAKLKPKKPLVALADQFGKRKARVHEARQLCNPVVKVHGQTTTPIAHKSAHLVCRRTTDKTGTKARDVRLRNQFGTVETRTTVAQALCVPSLKRIDTGKHTPPQGAKPEQVLDHFRCYGVDPRQVSVVVGLRDQFGPSEAKVIRLVRLCNPVRKTYKGHTAKIKRADAHLACYAITEHGPFKPRDVVVRNQFGISRLRAMKVATLCLPTFKTVVG